MPLNLLNYLRATIIVIYLLKNILDLLKRKNVFQLKRMNQVIFREHLKINFRHIRQSQNGNIIEIAKNIKKSGHLKVIFTMPIT